MEGIQGISCRHGDKMMRMQGLLLTDSTEKMDSMNLLRYMSPIAALLLVPITMLAERDVLTFVRHKASTDPCKPISELCAD